MMATKRPFGRWGEAELRLVLLAEGGASWNWPAPAASARVANWRSQYPAALAASEVAPTEALAHDLSGG